MTARPYERFMKDIAKLSKAQRRVLDEIGAGENCPYGSKRTFDSLHTQSFIVRLQDKVVGKDALGPITIPQWCMPPAVHLAWAELMKLEFEHIKGSDNVHRL